jgi:hypothetical protein
MGKALVIFQTVLALVFVAMKIAEVYTRWTKNKEDDKRLKENLFYQTTRGAYDFIKKEGLAGRILGDGRAAKALEYLETDLLKTGQGPLTAELKNKAEVAFKAWHSEDKISESMKDAVALDPQKSPGK